MKREEMANSAHTLLRGDGSIVVHRLYLRADGLVEGALHENESQWAVESGDLVLKHPSGTITTRFNRAEIEEGSRVLYGDYFQFDRPGWHILRPLTNAQAVQYPKAFSWSKPIEDFFANNKIFLAWPNRSRDVFGIGERIVLERPVEVEPYSTMPPRGFFCASSFSHSMSLLDNDTIAGRYCSIAKNCEVMGIEHPTDRISSHVFTFRHYYTNAIKSHFGSGPDPVPFAADGPPVRIGHDVWIGQNVLMKRGIEIGSGAVVAAGSVVVKDVPPFAIVGGVPARVIRMRFPTRLIERIFTVQWWRYHLSDFDGLDMQDPNKFLDGLERKIDAASIQPYKPIKINIGAEIQRISETAPR